MKLKTVSCTQFAGIRDRQVEFGDGVNVICGNNESGKTTLVNLLSRTLFQNAKLNYRSDKDFVAQFFPAALRSGVKAGDFADGKVSFETENGAFTLQKEWGADHRCILSTPDGVLRDAESVDAALREALGYGEGVYGQLLFSNRRDTDFTLQEVVDAAAKSAARQEVMQALSRAFSQTDGLSADAIEEAIEKKIEDIMGKHWDEERRQPIRKVGRWSSGLGQILKTWYALEDARELADELSELEDKAARTYVDYQAADADAKDKEAAAQQFRAFETRLTLRAQRESELRRLRLDLDNLERVLRAWPGQASELDTAMKLRKDRRRSEKIAKYLSAREVQEQLNAAKESHGSGPVPSKEDVEQVAGLSRQISRLEGSLQAMNLQAVLNMLDGHEVQVRTVRNNTLLDLSQGECHITEAVVVTVPGVMELRLQPVDVDADAVGTELAKLQEQVAQVLNAFHARTLAELEAMVQQEQTYQQSLERLEHKLELALAGEKLEDLAAYAEGETPRDPAQIERDLVALCDSMPVDKFITVRETVLENNRAQYGSPEQLQAQIAALSEKCIAAEAALFEDDDIPEEYRSLEDPAAYSAALERAAQEAAQKRERALSARIAASERLESRREGVLEEPAQLLEEAKREFEETQQLLDHWISIRKVFSAQKKAASSNPVDGLADSFSNYLQILSGGGVESEFVRGDRLDLRVSSHNRVLDFAKLSEGTKGTVSLAFRLAVLDQLFPGGGVIVLDDPFADMDMERTRQACRLIEQCAKRHQVIVLTCREEYLPLLGGNQIRLS